MEDSLFSSKLRGNGYIKRGDFTEDTTKIFWLVPFNICDSDEQMILKIDNKEKKESFFATVKPKTGNASSFK